MSVETHDWTPFDPPAPGGPGPSDAGIQVSTWMRAIGAVAATLTPDEADRALTQALAVLATPSRRHDALTVLLARALVAADYRLGQVQR